MGLNQSSRSSTQKMSLTNNVYNNCGSSSASNTAIISNVTVTPNPDLDCTDSKTVIYQGSSVEASCVISSLQDVAAQQATTLTTEQAAGLGINLSSDKTDNEKAITNYVDNFCASTNSENALYLDNIILESCNNYIVQESDASQTCKINASQQVLDSVVDSEYNNQVGASLLGLLFGNGLEGILFLLIIVIAIVAVLSILSVVIYKAVKSKPKDDSGESDASNIDPGDMSEAAKFEKEYEENVKTIENVSGGQLFKLFGGCGENKKIKNDGGLSIIIVVLAIILIALVLMYFYNKTHDNLIFLFAPKTRYPRGNNAGSINAAAPTSGIASQINNSRTNANADTDTDIDYNSVYNNVNSKINNDTTSVNETDIYDSVVNSLKASGYKFVATN
jgi:uncharacterized membrane protein